MKKVILVVTMVILGSLFLLSADAKAQSGPGWGGYDDDFYCPYCGRYGDTGGGYHMGPGYGGGYGMGPRYDA